MQKSKIMIFMDIASFIYNFCKENKIKNICELGIGYYFDVALFLNKEFNLLVVDRNEDCIKKALSHGLNGKIDDIFSPNLNIYEDVELFYSIRMPYDLQIYALELAKKLSVPFILKPLSNEAPHKSFKLIKNNIYLFMP
ncbi:UPF0146 family protein [Methanocaldococcus indicus]|uniref:UPF0146 family protein n=1 Tax=Methanocaldococcus indicus TaxID=213231 RepID=UPI003C6D64A4